MVFVRPGALLLLITVVASACTTVPERAYYADPADPETKVVANALWRAALASGDNPRRYSFAMIRTEDVTAYAAEDGIFYVTRGLARQPMWVLEPILAQQVAHEALGHAGERRTLSVTLGASFTVLGVAVPGLGLIDLLASPLVVRAWSRAQVLAADRKAVEMLAEMGYETPRRTLADALRKAEVVNGKTPDGLLASKPDLDARLAALEPLEPRTVAAPAAAAPSVRRSR